MKIKSKYKTIVLFLILFLVSQFISADDYRISVSREDANLYKVIGEDILILTQYCYEYVYYEDALLRMNGYSGEIVFLNSGNKCNVKAVYGPADIRPGTYEIQLNRESDNWYMVCGTKLFIKTGFCMSFGFMEDALLKISFGGMGEILFSDGSECNVEGVYTRLKL
jgi:hypothetical protein